MHAQRLEGADVRFWLECWLVLKEVWASLLQLPLEPMFILFCDPRADCPDPNRDLPRSNNTASVLAMTLCRACVPERRVWSWAGGAHICNTQEPRRERR